MTLNYFYVWWQNYILNTSVDDDFLLRKYFGGVENFTNRTESMRRVYFPINDKENHWFLAYLNYNMSTISISDTGTDLWEFGGVLREKRENMKKLARDVVYEHLLT